MKEKALIGLGNPLRNDDGIGIILIEELKKKQLKDYEIIDGGIGGINLLHVLSRYKKVILIDAFDFRSEAGDYKILDYHKLQTKTNNMNISTHECNFFKVLSLSSELKEIPKKIYIFGIQPKKTSYGEKISEELNLNINRYIDEIIKLTKEI